MPRLQPAARFATRISLRIAGNIAILAVLSSCARNPTEPVPTDILGKLMALPGVTVTEIEALYGYPAAFQIDFRQQAVLDSLGAWLGVEVGIGAGARGISVPTWASDPERVLPPI